MQNIFPANVDSNTTKICKTCKKIKVLSEFHNDKKSKDGHVNSCKECVAVRTKKYYIDNRDSVILKVKEYREENKYEISLQRKAYREENKELMRQRHKTYNIRNKDAIAAKKKIRYLQNRNAELERVKHYREMNKDKIVVKRKARYVVNKQVILAKARIYNQTPRGKETHLKATYKRMRNLGYNPINAKIQGYVFHHLLIKRDTGEIDYSVGIHIPYELHTSIYHNGSTGYNMDKINKSVLEWYLANTPVEELNPTALEMCKHYNIAVE